jgi:YD repeat-containing protein
MFRKIFNQKLNPFAIFTIFSFFILALLFLFTKSSLNTTSAQTNKTLIKLSNNATVYWYQNNKSYPVYSDTFTTMQSNSMPGWGSVNTVSSIPNNTGVSFIHADSNSNGLLIKQINTAAVYRTYNGTKEFISAAAFSRRGYSNNDVIDVTSSILSSFTNATDQMQFVSQTPADGTSYLPNTPFSVTWNLKNTGTTIWNGYQADWVQGSVSGNTSTNLTSPLRTSANVPDAAPGQTVPFTVSMISPSTPGTYYMYWRMRSLDGTSFGTNFFIRIVVPAPVDGMQYISQSPADGTAFNPGTPFTMTWRVKNTGNTTWNGYEAFWVQSPTSGNPSTNLTSPLKVSFSVPNIPPGLETDISVTMVAPSSSGTYYSYWQLRGATDIPFGIQFFIRIVVNAPTDGVTIESQSPPDDALLRSSETFDATWQLKNTGNTTWSNYSAVWIQTPVGGNPSTNLTSPLRVSMPLPTVTPGNTINLTIPMITPSAPGLYYMYWQLQNGSNVVFGNVFRIKVNVIQSGEASFGLDREDFGNADSPGSNVGVNDDSLNTATGNFNYQISDLTVASRGINFIFSRSYNAQDTTGGPLGIGWSHSYNIYLSFTPNNSEVVSVHYADGKRLSFGTAPSGNVYIPRTKGYYDTIIRNGDNTWSLIKPDQREFRFSNLGFLLYIQDQNNNRITLTYNGSDSIGKITDTVGREYIFTYTNFLLTQITDPIGRTLKFQYINGRLAKFTDARGNSNDYTYNANGHLSEIRDGRGIKVMTNSYDSQGRLISQRNGRNFLWEFTYDTVARKTYVTDPNSKQITYSHDAQNKLLSFSNRLATQNSTTVSYDSKDNRNAVTDSNDKTYGYEYDDKGNIEKSTDPLLKTRTFVYDNKNNPTAIKDELQNQTSYGYDNKGNLLTITNALSQATSVTYNLYGQPETITDPELNTTILTYDSQGNLKTVKDAENNTTVFNYDGVGRRVGVVNARGKTTTFSYDNNDNLLSVQRPIGGALYSYDE